jgi:NitT/TauT family transport system substrate-binding protein
MERPIFRLHFPSRCVLLLALVLFSGCGGGQVREPLRLGLLVWPPYELFFLARHLGYLDPDRVELVEYSSNADVVNAFRTGVLDAVAVTTDHYLDSLGANPDAVIVMIVNVSEGADALVARPELQSLDDLRGARVGLTPSSLGVFVVTRALDHAGLDFDAIVPVYLDEPAQEDAYATGAVDAVAVFEPVRSRLLARGATVLFDSSRIPGEIVDLLLVRRSLVDSRPEDVQSLVDGFFRARNELFSRPLPSARLIAPREDLTPEAFLEALEGVQLPGVEENRYWLTGPAPPLADSLASVNSVLQRIGVTPASIDPDNAIDPRFVLAARP